MVIHMILATSIMMSEDEREISKQKSAIKTWIDMGANVISCNVKEEIDKLKPVFDEVTFVELTRSGRESMGKPFSFIYDILQALKNHASQTQELCGIINSDIFLRNISYGELMLYFDKRKDMVLTLHRYDIECEDDTIGKYYFSGIDVFFFMAEYIDIFPDKGFMLGRPEWDHWFLYEASHVGMQVLEIKNQCAFHIKHMQRWTPKESNRMVMDKAKIGSNSLFDERFYYDTNVLMSDLSKRVLLGSLDTVTVTQKTDGYYYDADIKALMEWEKDKYGYSSEGTAGLLYFKGDQAYRICELHRKETILSEGNIILKELIEKPKGGILKYIDFRDLDFFKELGHVYVYPAGRAARLLVDCLNTYGVDVLGMVDTDMALNGNKYLGISIYDVSVLNEKEKYDNVLVASNLYIKEIYDELSKIVDKQKLIIL